MLQIFLAMLETDEEKERLSSFAINTEYGVMILMCILFQEIAMRSYYCIWLKV